MLLMIIAWTIGFALLIYCGYLIIDAVFLQRARVKKRLAAIGGQYPDEAGQQGPQIVERFPTIDKLIENQGLTQKLLVELLRAGSKLRPSEFVGIMLGLSLVLALIGGLMTRSIVIELLGLVIGILAPMAWLKSQQARRLTQFNRQLPDALSLISSSIRSGYSFQRAMQMVADEMPPPISDEFQRALTEMSVGLPTDQALLRMVVRMTSYDLELVVTAVIIQMQIGGNLAEIIDNIAETIRERVRIEGEVAALTAEGRISGVVLAVLPFAIAGAIYVLNPRYLTPLVSESIGHLMILGALCLQAMGALLIKKMLALDY